jgi:glycerophosphodiester phosphodiesterase
MTRSWCRYVIFFFSLSLSYGPGANLFCLVQRQVKEGIDAVIVDSVLAIRKGLTGGQETVTVATAAAAVAAGGEEPREKVAEVAVRSQSQTTNGNANGNENANGNGVANGGGHGGGSGSD